MMTAMVLMTAEAVGTDISMKAAKGVYTEHYSSPRRKVDGIDVDQWGLSSVLFYGSFLMKVWMKITDRFFRSCS